MKNPSLVSLLAGLALCASCQDVRPTPYTFDLAFVNGTPVSTMGDGQKLYAVWAEDESHGFIKDLYVCANCLAIPSRKMTSYWYAHVRPLADAVTGATHKDLDGSKDIDFTLENLSIPDATIRRFYVCFEIDRSWDKNEWFDGSMDQPAVLYRALVDLDAAATEFPLVPVGWTAGPMNDIASTGRIPGFALGELFGDLRYLTHRRNADDTFGAPDTDHYSALDMVGSVTVTVNK